MVGEIQSSGAWQGLRMELKGWQRSTTRTQPSLESRERGWKWEERVWIGRHWRKGLGQAALRVVWGWEPVSHPTFPCPPPHPHTCPSIQCSQRFQPYVLYCLRVRQTMAYALGIQGDQTTPSTSSVAGGREESLGKGDAVDLVQGRKVAP